MDRKGDKRMENYKLYALHNDILILIGQYGVTPAEAYFVLNKVITGVEATYLEQVNKEIEAEKKRQADRTQMGQSIIQKRRLDLIKTPYFIWAEVLYLICVFFILISKSINKEAYFKC